LWIRHGDKLVHVVTDDCDLVSRLTLKILATPAILSQFGYGYPPGPMGLHVTRNPPALPEFLTLEDIQYTEGYIENSPDSPLYLSVIPNKKPRVAPLPTLRKPRTPKSLWIKHSEYLVQVPTHDCNLVTELEYKILGPVIRSQFGYGRPPGPISLHLSPHAPALRAALPLGKIKNETGYIENSAQCPLYLSVINMVDKEVRFDSGAIHEMINLISSDPFSQLGRFPLSFRLASLIG
jgi:hypothetical protein